MSAEFVLNFYKNHKDLIHANKTYTDAQIDIKFHLLSGDMSYKQFFRVHYGERSYILVIIPTQGSASLELFAKEHQLPISPAESFIHTAQILARHLPNVSPVYAVDLQHGLILLNDHGNYLLEDYVNNHRAEPMLITYYFEKLFSWLHQFQQLPKKLSAEFFGLHRTFEAKAILEELNEFMQYGVLGYEKKQLSNDEKSTILTSYKQLSQRLAHQPLALIHRDFQSKNIMLEKNNFWVIDYQDICLGPYTYDYASIIFDPYLNLDEELQETLIELSWEINFKGQILFEHYHEDIRLCAKQRLLKAAGRYAKHLIVNGKDTHMQYYIHCTSKCDF